MTKAEEILKEALDIEGDITEKHYVMTVKVKDAIKAIDKALSINAVSCQREQLQHEQECYKSNEPCKYNCSGLCKESC